MGKLIDKYNRRVDYLRISVTDRCNLRCVYCLPGCGIDNKSHDDLLTFEEIVRIAGIAAQMGINKVRLTGGEPLVRKNLAVLVKMVAEIEGIDEISMTTNGILLKDYAHQLKRAGLKRVNVSLDTLRGDRFKDVTRFGELRDAMEGIEAALDAGLHPVKINVLLLAGVNDDEITDFLRLTIDRPLHVRFLEFMPITGNEFWSEKRFLSCKEAMDICNRFGRVESANVSGNGPARNFRIENASGTFGFIAALTDKFCSACNRLRLTSDGHLKGCLHSDLKVNLRDPLRNGADEGILKHLIRLVVDTKPREHSLTGDFVEASEYLMSQIGG
ncbi:MAG: GTP 3',8-cyclase MoaA [Candidatus Omnitrophica bacterium]|nr:GTP 3',8-cyclase MoaA [Candidatus Omnitrophota bacterium]